MGLKSCVYCGKIHDKKIVCKMKQAKLNQYTESYSERQETRFRWTKLWKDKAEEIKARDLCLCQICSRELYHTQYKYNPYDLSVHHITPLSKGFDRRLDNDNLITLCRMHHEDAERGTIPSQELRDIALDQEARRPV